MSSDAARASAPFTSVGRVEPHPPPGFRLRRDDFGAFRAVEPGTNDLVVFRPSPAGLWLERREGRELVDWADIRGLTLAFTDAGRAKVPTVRIELSAGPSLDFADALAPGADALPLTLGPGQGHLLRAERCRMLTAVIASAAGLAPATTQSFHRGPRGVAIPELAVRPRVLPRWAPPVLLLASIAAIMLVFDFRWTTAVAVTAVFVLHEAGHAAVMRLVGMRVRGVVFVPFLGAATLPEHSFTTRWDEARVVLAGPATGIPVAGAFAMLLFFSPSDAVPAATLGVALAWALGVNLLNLIPVLPLDGGRVLGCVAASLPRVPRAILVYLPIAVLAGVLVLASDGAGLIASMVFVAVCFSLTRTTLRRQAFHGWMEALPQSLAAVRSALRDVTFGFTGRAREDVEGGVAPTPLTFGQALAVMAILVAEALAFVVATAFFLEAFPRFLDFLRSNG